MEPDKHDHQSPDDPMLITPEDPFGAGLFEDDRAHAPWGDQGEEEELEETLQLSRFETPLDGAEDLFQRRAQALLSANARYGEQVAAPASARRAQTDWLYTLLFHYNEYSMDEELDGALSFMLEKYAIGAYRPPSPGRAAPETAPPLALHPSLMSHRRPAETAPGGPAGPDGVPDPRFSEWPTALPGSTSRLPARIRPIGERKLFGDSRSLWFIRDTVARLRALPPGQTLYKRFFLLLLIGMEPELQARVAPHCPRGTFAENETALACDADGRGFPTLLRHLSEQVVGQFNRFTAASVIRGYMQRVACVYDTGGVLR